MSRRVNEVIEKARFEGIEYRNSTLDLPTDRQCVVILPIIEWFMPWGQGVDFLKECGPVAGTYQYRQCGDRVVADKIR